MTMKLKYEAILEEEYTKISEALSSSTRRELTELLKGLLETADWTSVFSRPEGDGARVFINWLLDVAGYTEDIDERHRGQTIDKEKLRVIQSLKSLIHS